MDAVVVGLSPEEFRRRLDEVMDVFRNAFAAVHLRDPSRAASERRGFVDQHTRRAGFTAFGVLDGDVLVGFAYAVAGLPGTWWYDVVTARLTRDAAQRWFTDVLEVAEVHVLPSHQGLGLGRELVRRLCADGAGSHRTVALSALDLETPARHLYRSLGFLDVATGFRFPGTAEPYAIMAVDLPLRAMP